MLDWHSCQICYSLEIEFFFFLLLLLWNSTVFASLLDKEDALDDFTEKIDKNEDKKVTWSEYLAHLNTTEKDVQRIRNKKNKTKEEESLLKVHSNRT